MARKPISASTRWAVFSRDNFRCRYCGAQAGQDGVALVVDHVLSVADGGDNRMDNLLSACQRCNGGKGARSLRNVLMPQEALDAAAASAQTAAAYAEALSVAAASQQELEQEIVNAKCLAYAVSAVQMRPGEATRAIAIAKEFGADKLLEFYQSCAKNGVTEWEAIRYISGCARRTRERAEQGQ